MALQSADSTLSAGPDVMERDNVEQLFSLWDMERELGDLSAGERVQRLVRVMARSIELSFSWEGWLKLRETAGYARLLRALWTQHGPHWIANRDAPFSFVTLNYDLALESEWHTFLWTTDRLRAAYYQEEYSRRFIYLDDERALKVAAIIEETGAKPRTPLARYSLLGRDLEDPGALYPRILKLHGSINWGICPTCGNIRVFESHSGARESGPRVLGRLLSEPCQWHPETRSRANGGMLELKSFRYQPLLVPPTLGKMGQCSTLRDLWRQAADEVALSSKLVFIGYSLPDTDVHIRYLLAAGLSRRELPDVMVVNSHSTQDGNYGERSIKSRYERALSITFNGRHEYVNDTFTNSIGRIMQFLQS